MITKQDPIGIRVLTKNMMSCSFKHTDEVLDAIKKIRTTAYIVQDEFRDTLQKSPNEGVMAARGYNNAISILGSRGAGKTSIIMTLQHILRRGYEAWEKGELGQIDEQNIMMPILVPQDFAPEQSLLSWVIMQLLQKGEEIEKIITDENMYMGGSKGPFAKWNTPKHKPYAYDPLRECMDRLTNSYELRYKRDAGYEATDSEHVFEYMDEVRRDAQLLFDMLKLVSMIVDFYRYKRLSVSVSNNWECEPLIFFVIDDLDLAPSRSQEVLNLVLRYLQHPNIVILCGWNQELFQSHLCMDLLKTQGALDSELLDTNLGYDDIFMTRQRQRVAALDSARRLAMDNLKKAFPPALRYEIRGLSTLRRACFPNTPFNDTLPATVDCLFNVIHSALCACRVDKKSSVDFLYHNGKAILTYMRIFDNKARGLVNAYSAFQMLQQRAEKWNKKSELDLTSQIISLVDTLLFSNTHFVPYRRGLRDLIKINKVVLYPKNRKVDCDYYCNFKAAEKVLSQYNLDKEDSDPRISSDDVFHVERQYNYFPSIVIDAYILLNFIENMLQFICCKPNYEHGGVEFSRVLNAIVSPIRNSPDPDDLLSCALTLSGIEKVSLFPETRDFRVNLLLLNAYESNGLSDEGYEFTGVHSYCKLSKSLEMIGAAPEQKEKTDRLRNIDEDWYRAMNRLLGSLCDSQTNVKRLTIYRSLLYQSKTEQDDALFIVNSLPDITVDIHSWNITKFESYSITMNELKDITYIIRSMFSFVRKWKRIDRRDKEAVIRGKMEMNQYLHLFMNHSANADSQTIVLSTYKDKLEQYRRAVLDTSILEEVTRKYSEERELDETLDLAVYCAKRNIDLLLSDLKTMLQYACYKMYTKKATVYDQFLYLLDVSKKIPDILNELHLGTGLWTVKENNAVFTLMEVLREYDISDLYDNVRRILDLGPKLSQTSRDTYIHCLQQIKREINRVHTLFAKKDLSRIELSLGVLQDAYQNIQRDTEVEERLSETFLSFGRNVAVICAQLSEDPDILKGRSEKYQREVAWPVAMNDRKEFEKWEMTSSEQGLFT